MEININDSKFLSYFLGTNDRTLKLLKEKLEINVIIINDIITISGKDELIGVQYINSILELYDRRIFLKEEDIINGINRLAEDPSFNFNYLLEHRSLKLFFSSGQELKPKNNHQKKYLEAIDINDITFGIGPAGTGKTYLAVAMAVKYLSEKRVDKIILTRPAVEAGESLGFLPGDLKEKIDPYLRPLYDALFDMLGPDKTQRYMEKNMIEIAPLAYMRGRTLNNAFIILDEAQNTTTTQMKMFLTRFGFNSKAVITGDVTQIDLKKGENSGLIQAVKILKNIENINITEFCRDDVVRNKIVKEIVRAYEKLGEEL